MKQTHEASGRHARRAASGCGDPRPGKARPRSRDLLRRRTRKCPVGVQSASTWCPKVSKNRRRSARGEPGNRRRSGDALRPQALADAGFGPGSEAVAERSGFEPENQFDPVTALAMRRFRPLSHLSAGMRGGNPSAARRGPPRSEKGRAMLRTWPPRSPTGRAPPSRCSVRCSIRCADVRAANRPSRSPSRARRTVRGRRGRSSPGSTRHGSATADAGAARRSATQSGPGRMILR